ncbi:MAG: phosphatase PAP2 family protein, partial [Planctomycetes bacterium]|nr:phosphatase PAP2 family protein [Planctomycetota bacterium]
WQDVWKLPDVIVENDKEIVANDRYLTWLLLAGGASIALYADGADQDIADDMGKPSLDGDLDRILDYVGGPGQHFAAAGLWYLIAADKQDTIGKERAWTMIKALSVTGATTLGSKLIRNDDTPNGKDLAWPSGHTSSSFTVASVLDEFYGPEVGIPAYFVAGFVGYRMMDSGDHWASDVLFGAVLGYITGHHVAGKHNEGPLAGIEITPLATALTDENLAGISLVKRF